jgi:hypothetical protein
MRLVENVKRLFYGKEKPMANSDEGKPMVNSIPKFIYDPQTVEHMRANISDIEHERWKIPDLDNGGYKKKPNGCYEYVDTNWVPHPEKRGFVSIWEVNHPLANAWKALRSSGQDIEAYDSELLRARERADRIISPIHQKLSEMQKYLDILKSEKVRLSNKGLDFLVPHLEREILCSEQELKDLNDRFAEACNRSDRSFEDEVTSLAAKQFNAVKPHDLLKTRTKK